MGFKNAGFPSFGFGPIGFKQSITNYITDIIDNEYGIDINGVRAIDNDSDYAIASIVIE